MQAQMFSTRVYFYGYFYYFAVLETRGRAITP